MGLDQFLFEIKGCSLRENTLYREKELRSNDFSIFNRDIEETIFLDRKFAPVLVEDEIVNVSKIQSVCNFADTPHIWGFGSDSVFFGGTSKAMPFAVKAFGSHFGRIPRRTKSVPVKNGELAPFSDTRTEKCTVVRRVEVAYWRKEYSLQEAVYDAFEQAGVAVLNIGYYPLSLIIESLTDEETVFGTPNPFLGFIDNIHMSEGTKIEDLYYHEWY